MDVAGMVEVEARALREARLRCASETLLSSAAWAPVEILVRQEERLRASDSQVVGCMSRCLRDFLRQSLYCSLAMA